MKNSLIRDTKCDIKYGHNGDQVLVAFSQLVAQLAMTPQEVDKMVNGLKVAKTMLLKHKVKK